MARMYRTDEAASDLREIAKYLAHEAATPTVAHTFLDAVAEKLALYAEQPELGQLRPELGNGYRSFHHKRWIAIYRPIDDGILLLRIVDGARDYPLLF